MFAFSNQTAVVTGASSGIGKAIALALAGQGATLCLVGRKLDRLEAIAESVRAQAPRVVSYQVDLTIDENVRDLKAKLQREFGSIDLLIRCAGVISIDPIESAPVEDLDWQCRIKCPSPILFDPCFAADA